MFSQLLFVVDLNHRRIDHSVDKFETFETKRYCFLTAHSRILGTNAVMKMRCRHWGWYINYTTLNLELLGVTTLSRFSITRCKLCKACDTFHDYTLPPDSIWYVNWFKIFQLLIQLRFAQPEGEHCPSLFVWYVLWRLRCKTKVKQLIENPRTDDDRHCDDSYIFSTPFVKLCVQFVQSSSASRWTHVALLAKLMPGLAVWSRKSF